MAGRILRIGVISVLLSTAAAFSKDVQPGYGYVGPACAVVDGTLFLHGVGTRSLDDYELELFRVYQQDLSAFKDAVSTGIDFPDAPLVPSFCGGHDDSVEVVLSSCIVRNNHVYVGDRLIRSLTNQEKQRVETVKSRKAVVDRRMRRVKRDPEVATGPGTTPQFDFSALLQRLLNVNSTVSSRFLPVVSKSPLFAMDGPWQNLLGLGEEGPTPSEEDLSKVDSAYRAVFTTPVRPSAPTSTIPTTTTTTTTTTATTPKTTFFTKPTLPTKTTARVRHISLKPIYTTASPISGTESRGKELRRRPLSTPASRWMHLLPTTTPATYYFGTTTVRKPEKLQQSDSETVVDPLIISLISRALASNQVLSNLDLPSRPATASIPFHGFVPTAATSSPLHLRFVAPAPGPPSGASTLQAVPGPSHNNVFLPHLSFTSFAKGDQRLAPPSSLASTILPDDICRVHLAIPFF